MALQKYEKDKAKCSKETRGRDGKPKTTIDGWCWMTTTKPELKTDTPGCLISYEKCFEKCGGTVKKEVGCTENCDKQ
jgi:hypothetical protein